MAKQSIVIIILGYAKDYAKDYFKHIIFLLLCAFFSWIGYEIKTGVNKFTSLPDKYEKMIKIREQDSIRATNHLREDSLKDIENSKEYITLKHKIDSIGRKSKYNDSIFSILENEDYLNIKTILTKLKIK